MIETSNVLVVQIFLICLVVVGIITVKARIVDGHTRNSLSDIVLYIFLPCNILSSFFGTDISLLPSIGIMLVISSGILAFTLILSLVLYKRINPEQKKVLLYGTIISNANFLGIPVVEGIYGITGVPYVAAYVLPLRIAVWTFGLAIFIGGKSNLKKVFFHPCLIATYLGLLVMITGFTPPALLSRLVYSLGNCTTPVSMMVVGCILAMVDVRKLVSKLTVLYTFVRLAFIPFCVMGILLLIRPAPMVTGVSVLLSGMPAAVTTTILADKYGADKELASSMAFMSTLLSIFTAPSMAYLLSLIL